MAGLGRKTFTAGEVLTAANVNGFLMDQSVMVFANSAARTTAIPTPTEGMVTYLEDTNALEVFTGASFVSIAEDSPITTQGDLIIGDASGDPVRLAVGAADTVLTSDGTTLSFAAPSSGASDFALISSGSLPTGAASATISGLSGYSDYIIDFGDTLCASAGFWFTQLNTAAEFDGTRVDWTDGDRMNAATRTAQSLLFAETANSTTVVAQVIVLTGAGSTARCGVFAQGGPDANGIDFRVFFNSGSAGKSSLAFDSFTVNAPGNITAGTYRVLAR